MVAMMVLQLAMVMGFGSLPDVHESPGLTKQQESAKLRYANSHSFITIKS